MLVLKTKGARYLKVSTCSRQKSALTLPVHDINILLLFLELNQRSVKSVLGKPFFMTYTIFIKLL